MRKLTPDQQRRFQSAHHRFLIGVSITFGYCIGWAVVSHFISLNPIGMLVAVGGIIVTAVLIWSMFGYRCPACGTTPRARVWSFDGGEVAYSSMVALFPKECSCCGVQLDARLPD